MGCGKLRYSETILKRTDTLALVDSEVQLSRRQVLNKKFTSIREITKRSNRVTAYNDVEFTKVPPRFDRGFCINVLSVVPIYAVRVRILESIKAHLDDQAECLFVVQYRNSDFSRMRQLPNARCWRDGFLIDSLRGYSFYGLISPERLLSKLRATGFVVQDVTLNEGSAYVWATPK